MARREWSDSEKATALAALDANGGNVSHTARQLGIPRMTLADWAAGRVTDDVTELRQEKKESLADAFEALARKLVAGVGVWVDQRLEEGCNPATVGTTLGIVVDKMQLLRGDPTHIAGQAGMPPRRLDGIIEQLGGDRREEECTPQPTP